MLWIDTLMLYIDTLTIPARIESTLLASFPLLFPAQERSHLPRGWVANTYVMLPSRSRVREVFIPFLHSQLVSSIPPNLLFLSPTFQRNKEYFQFLIHGIVQEGIGRYVTPGME